MPADSRDPNDGTASGPAGIPAVSYDEVPYPARAFPWSHPERIATVLTLLGLRPPPLENCRVLDLGCATGGNLIPMAEDLSGGRFVGLDLSRVQIETARDVAGRLGLKNVEFRCQDLMDYGRGRGAGSTGPSTSDAPEIFDYIIAHGLYSWVPAAVRDRLLEVCARHLAPGGVAFVSYNAFPGWHAHAALREMMLTHVWGAGAEPGSAVPKTPQEVLAKARQVLDFLATTPLAEGPWGAVLKETAATVRALPDANLLHDHLGPINQPAYVAHFVAHPTGKGLRYLGDAQPLPPPGAHGAGPCGDGAVQEAGEPAPPAISSLASTPLRGEQLADVLRNRPFRQSLLCRADAPPARLQAPGARESKQLARPPARPAEPPPGLLSRGRPAAAAAVAARVAAAEHTEAAGPTGPVPMEGPGGRDFFGNAGLDARQVRRLFVASATRPPVVEAEFGTPAPEVFTTPHGVSMTVGDPLLKSALRCLAEAWPARLPFDGLLDAAWKRMGLVGSAGADTGADQLCTGLLHAFLAGAVELSVRPVPCALGVTDRPAARPLARLQAETEDTVTTLRHENLRLNTTARYLLMLLDGTRDFAAVASTMGDIVQDNARNIDPSLTLTEEDRRQLAQGLEQDLRRLAVEGVLVG